MAAKKRPGRQRLRRVR